MDALAQEPVASGHGQSRMLTSLCPMPLCCHALPPARPHPVSKTHALMFTHPRCCPGRARAGLRWLGDTGRGCVPLKVSPSHTEGSARPAPWRALQNTASLLKVPRWGIHMIEGTSGAHRPLGQGHRAVTDVRDKIFSTPHREKGGITNKRNTTQQNVCFKKPVLERILHGRRTLGKI